MKCQIASGSDSNPPPHPDFFAHVYLTLWRLPTSELLGYSTNTAERALPEVGKVLSPYAESPQLHDSLLLNANSRLREGTGLQPVRGG